LGLYLGDDFLDAQPENPTGYWEDRRIVELNDRVLKALGLRWDDAGPIDAREFNGWRMWQLRRQAIRDLRRRFTPHRLWGFKDPRTIRLLPFWRRVLRDCKVDDAYLVVIRNPASIAASLYARQKTDAVTAQRLWLVHMLPFLHAIADRPLAVVDYDLFMDDPQGQLARIARRFGLPNAPREALEGFTHEFLNEKLRHSKFSPQDVDTSTDVGRLTRDAFMLLYELASDQSAADAEFWSAWGKLRMSFDPRFDKLRIRLG